MTKWRGRTLLLAAGLLAGCGSALPPDQQIQGVVSEAADDGFTGAVLVARGGKTIYQKQIGMADRAHGKPIEAGTRFAIASLSKPFTAVLVMQLIEQGKLKTSDRLGGLFPGIGDAAVGAVTIGQLLSHTSGIEELTERHLDRPLVAEDLATARLSQAPGAFHYSSAGYVVLKLVVEKVSGRAFADLLAERILKPAGMADSGVLRTGVSVDRLAFGYGKDGKVASLPVKIELLDGAGSLFATTGDLAKFDRALAEGRLISPETQKVMNARHTAEGDTEWGYGWALAEQGGHWYPWHKGDLPGYSAAFARQTYRDGVVVILSNTENADVSAMRRDIMRILKRD
jgi:CubicO group peptidase (beta-lactamase class C family)